MYTLAKRMDGLGLTLSDYLDKKKVRHQHRQAIFNAFDHKCAYCGQPAQSLDHVKPKHKGGQNLSSNLVPACLACNQSKGSTSLWNFFHEQQSFYSETRADFLKKWISGEIHSLEILTTQELDLNTSCYTFTVSFT
jgi:hypothetical protein